MDAAPPPRPEFGASTWFSISGGDEAGAEPRRLLPMLCKAGNLSKDDIGAIRVRRDQSYVQIAEASVAGFLQAIGPDMVIEEGAVATQLASPPMLNKGQRPSGPRKGGKPKRDFDKPRKPYDPSKSRDDEHGSYDKPKKEYRAKPAGRSGGGRREDRDAKPAYDPTPHGPKTRRSKPKGPPPPKGKPSSKKNKAATDFKPPPHYFNRSCS